jgi:hypothetical protein
VPALQADHVAEEQLEHRGVWHRPRHGIKGAGARVPGRATEPLPEARSGRPV